MYFTSRPTIVLFTGLIYMAAHAQSTRPTLERQTAEAIARACHDRARTEGLRMAVAVNDEAGQLLYFSRMNGAPPISVPVSQLKANTSSALPISTRQFRDAVKANQGAELLAGITTVAGGLPIRNARGQTLGSVGVSGGSEDQDEACGQAGLDAVKARLP
jgi:uncharacterized protein GlcG (DUF336 family)